MTQQILNSFLDENENWDASRKDTTEFLRKSIYFGKREENNISKYFVKNGEGAHHLNSNRSRVSGHSPRRKLTLEFMEDRVKNKTDVRSYGRNQVLVI